MKLRQATATFTLVGLMLYTISLLPAGEPLQSPGDHRGWDGEPEPEIQAQPQQLIYRDPVIIELPGEFYDWPGSPLYNGQFPEFYDEQRQELYWEPVILELTPEPRELNLIRYSQPQPSTQEVQL